jgi:ribonuclease HI
MLIQAIIRALETTPITSVPLVIKSDSEYAIKCIYPPCTVIPLLIEFVGFTDWLPGWRRRNFTTSKGTPVKNVELVKYMDALFSTRQRSGQEVRLEHVRGHAGEEGNEGADALAVCGTKLQEVEEPDWDALRSMLEKEPMRGKSTSTKLADGSVSQD